MNKKNIFKLFCLVSILIIFYSATGDQKVLASPKTTKNKAIYTIYTYKKNFGVGKRVTGRYSYELPQLKGNSSIVKKINTSLKKDYDASKSEKKQLAGYVREDNKRPNYNNKYTSITTCQVTYNKRGYVSFRFDHAWYAGGVANNWTEGKIYDLKTGKSLNVSNVISGNANTIKQKIINKYLNKFPEKRANNNAWEELSEKKMSEFQFYLKNSNVVICFGPYQPGGGLGKSQIILKGNYI